MSADPVTAIPHCEESRRVSLTDDGEKWQAYWIDAGPDDKLLFYCLGCAEREFGER